MKQKKILIVLGGVSSEREISLRSGKACIKALKQLKYNVLAFDPAKEHLNNQMPLEEDCDSCTI